MLSDDLNRRFRRRAPSSEIRCAVPLTSSCRVLEGVREPLNPRAAHLTGALAALALPGIRRETRPAGALRLTCPSDDEPDPPTTRAVRHATARKRSERTACAETRPADGTQTALNRATAVAQMCPRTRANVVVKSTRFDTQTCRRLVARGMTSQPLEDDSSLLHVFINPARRKHAAKEEGRRAWNWHAQTV